MFALCVALVPAITTLSVLAAGRRYRTLRCSVSGSFLAAYGMAARPAVAHDRATRHRGCGASANGSSPQLRHRESSEDAIISKDLDGIIRSWNRGAEALRLPVGGHRTMSRWWCRRNGATGGRSFLNGSAKGCVKHFGPCASTRTDAHSVSLTISPVRTAGQGGGRSHRARHHGRIQLEEQMRQAQKLESLGAGRQVGPRFQ